MCPKHDCNHLISIGDFNFMHTDWSLLSPPNFYEDSVLSQFERINLSQYINFNTCASGILDAALRNSDFLISSDLDHEIDRGYSISGRLCSNHKAIKINIPPLHTTHILKLLSSRPRKTR